MDYYLQADLNSFAEAAEPTMRFLAMLAGPFYPILRIASERYMNLAYTCEVPYRASLKMLVLFSQSFNQHHLYIMRVLCVSILHKCILLEK